MRAFVALALLVISTPVHAAAPSYSKIVRQFEAIAFSDEGGTYSNSFERWERPPIRIRVVGGDTSPLLQDVINQLRKLSGLNIQIREPANVIVEYVARECSFKARGPRATVRIATNSKLATTHCTYEELAQLIGPADDACRYRPSIFCDPDFPTRYTEADKIILRATFDPRLRKGMTREEGMPIARIILRELYEEAYGPFREVEEPEAEEDPSLP